MVSVRENEPSKSIHAALIPSQILKGKKRGGQCPHSSAPQGRARVWHQSSRLYRRLCVCSQKVASSYSRPEVISGVGLKDSESAFINHDIDVSFKSGPIRFKIPFLVLQCSNLPLSSHFSKIRSGDKYP